MKTKMEHYKLLSAAQKGDSLSVRQALERGAFINSTNPNGDTALHLACNLDSFDVIKLLGDWKQVDSGHYHHCVRLEGKSIDCTGEAALSG